MLMTACQKEAAQVAKPATNAMGIVTTSTIPGVSVKQDGFPYPNMSTSSSLTGTDDIGWSIDLNALAQSNLSGSTKESGASNLGPAYLYCGGIHTSQLMAGQNIPMGTLSWANDATNFYVTYTTNPDWYMSEVHLYVGALNKIPKAGGNPPPGQFPISTVFSSSTLSQSITYTIPISSALSAGGFAVAAHASVLQVDIDGDVVGKETAWASGPKIPGAKNWSMYVSATLGDCYSSGLTKDNSKN